MPDGAGIFRQNFTGSALLESSIYFFHLQDCHLLWLSFPEYSTRNIKTLGLVRVRSPLLAESLIDFLSYGYLDVSVPRVSYKIGLQPIGFPHSDIYESKVVCTSS